MRIKSFYFKIIPGVWLLMQLVSCKSDKSNNQEMIQLLATIDKSEQVYKNPFASTALLAHYDSLLSVSTAGGTKQNYVKLIKGLAFLNLGQEQKAVYQIEDYLNNSGAGTTSGRTAGMQFLALAYLRLGERTNCVNNHGLASCVFPIQGPGVHTDKTGSEKAIEVYKKILAENPNDLESRWLLNIAYMTIAQYPDGVPKSMLIPGLNTDTVTSFRPFVDVAMNMGLNTNNMAGGSIIDDFDNDGYLDLVTSGWGLREGMHYMRNNTDGSFTDLSEKSGLKFFTGGLNIIQADYNNDGNKDIFVLRGAWKGEYGQEPNSLLRNNGNGTFTDVTKQSGLLSFHPTQAATWNDFNNDGWLDVFIGNETKSASNPHPSELYMSNGDGTFTEIAQKAGCEVIAFVKGVTSGDYDKDGLTDIFVSTLHGKRILFKNDGVKNGLIHFSDVTAQAGLNDTGASTFPTWFWDYDNDGWLDILVCGYNFERTLAHYAAAEALGKPEGDAGHIFLYRNKQNGTFENVTNKMGLNKIAFAMGSNFGDIDNDGYLDFYLGTGNPAFQSLVPNKLFRNERGEKFTDITTAARVGNLQKGHGVSFSDWDNDGDEDIYIEMGGAYEGDAYPNSLYINPGQNTNNWITVSLEGVLCNKAAVGAKLKVTFDENGVERSVYRDVNSGGSFGSNPLQQHIGIGTATAVKKVEVLWPVTKKTQVFTNVKVNTWIKITEGNNTFTTQALLKADFEGKSRLALGCAPVKKTL